MCVCYESGEYAAALFVCLWGVGDTKAKMAYEVFTLFFCCACQNFPFFAWLDYGSISRQYISERMCGVPSEILFLLCCPLKCFVMPVLSTVTCHLGMYPKWWTCNLVSMLLKCLDVCVCVLWWEWKSHVKYAEHKQWIVILISRTTRDARSSFPQCFLVPQLSTATWTRGMYQECWSWIIVSVLLRCLSVVCVL